MKHYFVISWSKCFGFGGFGKKAFTTESEARDAMAKLKAQNCTDIELSEVDAKNKKEAESNRPSMFAGPFTGIDKVNI